MSKNYGNNLARRYKDICNEYLVAFCDNYNLSIDDDAWVAGDVGTIACLSDYYFDFHDVIKYAVDNDLHDWDDLIRWYDYSLFASEFNQTIPNFKSWCKGCPRLNEQEQQRLVNLKKDLQDAIKDYKERTNKQSEKLF